MRALRFCAFICVNAERAWPVICASCIKRASWWRRQLCCWTGDSSWIRERSWISWQIKQEKFFLSNLFVKRDHLNYEPKQRKGGGLWKCPRCSWELFIFPVVSCVKKEDCFILLHEAEPVSNTWRCWRPFQLFSPRRIWREKQMTPNVEHPPSRTGRQNPNSCGSAPVLNRILGKNLWAMQCRLLWNEIDWSHEHGSQKRRRWSADDLPVIEIHPSDPCWITRGNFSCQTRIQMNVAGRTNCHTPITHLSNFCIKKEFCELN